MDIFFAALHVAFFAPVLFRAKTRALAEIVAGALKPAMGHELGGDLRARVEEQALVEAFGDRYRTYMKQVRRTLPLVY